MFSSKSKNYQIDMCNGTIFPKLLSFALPLMGSSILQLLFNAADIVVVGKFAGDNSLAAVGSTSSLINLITNLFIGLSIGTNVIVAKDFGAKNEKELKETIHTSIVLSFISGIILTVIGVLGTGYILKLMQSPKEVLILATKYLKIYFLGITATMVYNFGSAILRAVGDTKRPLYFLFAAGIINVVLNLFFVIVFDLGVVGVAAATAISQFFAAGCIIFCLIKDDSNIHLNIRELSINRVKFIQILRTGLPAGFQGVVFSLSNVVIQSAVNTFGPITIAGNSAAQNIEGFIYVSMNAFYQAAISFTSQNYGANNFNRIKKISIYSLICVFFTGFILGLLTTIFSDSLLKFYSSNPDVIQAGQIRLSVICSFYFLCGMMDTLVGCLRGIGYSIMPMIVSLLGACGLRLLWIGTIFQISIFHTIQTIYFSYPISWTITLLTHLVCFIYAFNKVKNFRYPFQTK